MRFPKTLVCVVAFAALLSVGRSAQAQTTYEISVVLDDSTAADDDLLNAAVLAAPSGEAVPSIRKLAAGLMLEVRLLVQQRVQDWILTLDDGVQVPLVEGDSIKANMKKRCTSLTCDPNYTGAILVPRPRPRWRHTQLHRNLQRWRVRPVVDVPVLRWAQAVRADGVPAGPVEN